MLTNHAINFSIHKPYYSICYCDKIQDVPPEVINVEKRLDDITLVNSTEFAVEGPIAVEDKKASCSTSEKEGIMKSRLERCDFYNASNLECVRYINEELHITCGSYHSCVVTSNGEQAAWKTYWATSSKSVINDFEKSLT